MLNDKIVGDMSVEELMEYFPTMGKSMAEWWLSSQGGNAPKITIEEFLTNRCEMCKQIIEVYENPSWRVNMHKIRCDVCAEIVRNTTKGEYSVWESYYVM